MQGHIRKRHRATCATKKDRAKRCNCDGPYQARYRDPDDPRKWHEKSFRLDRDARDWLQTEQGAQLRGDWVSPRQGNRVFGEVLVGWQQSWDDRLSPTTIQRYNSIIAKYLTPEFGNVPVARISHERVQRYIDLLKKDHAPGTVRNVYAVLRTAMNYGVKNGIVKVNPCLAMDLPRQHHDEPVFLTADEVRAVAETIDAQYKVLVYFAAWTGLRAGELGGLQRRDVRLNGTVSVERSLKDVNGKLELGALKTKQSRRVITMPKFLAEMMRQHLATPGEPDDYVFTMKNGQRLRHNLVYRYFRRAAVGYVLRGKEVPGALPASKHNVRWHDLRHTAASLAIAAGAHPKLISARLGHSTITITLDRYGHLFPSVDEALADALDAHFHTEPEQSNVVALAR